MRVLARRDDLAFIELSCPGCGSAALGLLMAPATWGDEPVLDVAADLPTTGPERDPAMPPPISQADVDAIRADLAAWQGDLVGWLAR